MMIGSIIFAAVCFYNNAAFGGIFGILGFAYEAFYINHLRDCREGWTVFDIDPETGEEVEYKVYPRI